MRLLNCYEVEMDKDQICLCIERYDRKSKVLSDNLTLIRYFKMKIHSNSMFMWY